MVSKIRIKFGIVEIEYEGDEVFFRDELPQILSEVSQLIKQTGIDITADITDLKPESTLPANPNNSNYISTSAIAAKLGKPSGANLILAAAARLTFGLQHETFSRDELLAEMKEAPSFYKKSYVNNLSRYLDVQIKAQTITSIGKNKYSLSAKARTNLESLCAQ